MRCPKCGYISFDDLESCSKCKKSIQATNEVVQGAVFHVAAPIFLQFDAAAASGQEEIEEAVSEEVEETYDLDMQSEDDEIAFDFDQSSDAEEEAMDDSMEIMEMEDDEPEETISLRDDKEMDLQPSEEEPHMDFSDIDLSDLGPPEEEAMVVEETLALDDTVDAITPPGPSAGGGAGLEDLQVDDLDLDGPSPLVSGSKTGKKLMPGTKTGTALDEFNIDLGELFPEK